MDEPAAFDGKRETIAFLARAKKRAGKNFSFKKAAALQDAVDLAYWLYVFGREDEALEVATFLGAGEFTGRYDLWGSIEESLALQSRILRQRKKKSQADQCLARIRKVGVQPMRLKGGLLVGSGGFTGLLDQIQACLDDENEVGARDWRLTAIKELCCIKELGGSKKWSVQKTEKTIQEQLAALRTFLKIAK